MSMYKYNFLSTYKRNKDAFIKPKIKFFFGLWKNEPNLPVWRRGNFIEFSKYSERNHTWDYARLVKSEWNELGKQNHPILSKIFKPMYQLPLWLSFYIFNHDIMYKTKWSESDFRYEYPSHFTIVFFGLCFSMTAYIPKKNEDDWICQDQYWESMLTYEYYNRDLEKTNDVCGWYNRPGDNNFRFKFDSRFLKKKEDREKLIEIQNNLLPEIIKQYEEEEKEIEENKVYCIQAEIRNVDPNEDGRSYDFDGWFTVIYDNKKLIYADENTARKVLDNIKPYTITKGGVKKNVEFKLYIGDKRYLNTTKTVTLYKKAIINKEINILNGIYEYEQEDE